MKKLIVLYSADLYEDFACYGYKRERQDLAKILQLLNANQACGNGVNAKRMFRLGSCIKHNQTSSA